jgi:iron(III) transport system substrate-binding protein
MVSLLAVSCGNQATKQEVVVYSPHGKEILEPVEKAFETAHPDIDLIWYDLPTATCASRIRAEAAAPQADVWWGGPAGEFIAAERSGLLAAYTPSWIDQVDSSTYSQEQKWFSDWQTPEVIMYNKDKLTAEEAPQDWDDVLDPKWSGRLIIRDPLQSGTMKTIYGAMVLRASSVDAGFEWLKKLDKQNKGEYAAKPLMMYEEIKRGKGDISLWNMAVVFIHSGQNG